MNVVVLMGRLTDNPELRHTSNGVAYTRFSIAINRRSRSDERQTDFINCVAWRQTAEFITNYFHKGQMIAIDGSIQTGRYQDKDGNNRTSFDVVVNNAYFTESKKDSSNSAIQNEQPSAPASFSNSDSGDFSEISSDDDLPF